MRLVFLGTTGYHPNNIRHTACLMFPELGLIFDAGSGLFRAHKLICTSELDIYLSHAHLDHVFGLTFLFDVLQGHQVDRVTIHGRPVDLQAIDEHLFHESLFPVRLPHELRPLDGPQEVAGSGKLTHFPVDHPGGAVGYRVDWPDATFAYVTDTVATEDAAYLDMISGVDLLVHECYFRDDRAEWAKKTGHSYTSPVAKLAKRAGVGRMILVHVNPMCEDDDPIDIELARSIFPATEVGTDFLEVEFGR